MQWQIFLKPALPWVKVRPEGAKFMNGILDGKRERKIKVLHIIKTLNFGGAELNLFNLIQGIDPEQFEMHVGYSSGGEFESRFKEKGIKLFKFSEGNHKIKSLASFVILLRLIFYILKNKINIVQTHTFNAHIWGSIAAKIVGAKIIEHVHDFRYLTPLEFKRRRGVSRQYRYVKYLKNISDIVVVLTKQNYKFLISNKLYAENQVREIKNGVPFPKEMGLRGELKKILQHKLNIAEDSLVILTPCRIAPEKNIDLIFRIAPIVKEECRNAVFIVSGDGPLFEAFKEKCRELNLDSTIKMIGFYSQVYELLSISDIFLLPSFLELHSIALLESLSMKIPVVVSKNVGCNDEFIKSWDNGVLLDPFKDEGWAQVITKLLRDRDLRQSIGQKGYALCKEQFAIKHVAKKFEALYVELAGK